ncbi:MAG: FAD-dependent oxidoreductase [Chloroflexi bacterium]|nr:FAD-dependent oxidoreductase [Chloroflexota bacterium]
MRLLEPITVGYLQLRNRIVVPAMNTNYPTLAGEVTDQQVEFYRARAKGGAGMIVTGFSYVHPLGRGPARMLASYDDQFVPGLARWAAAVKAEGAKACLQIAHVGRRANSKTIGAQPVGPSAITPAGGELPRALSKAEIEELVVAFAKAAARGREAGFDAVEVHMAHGYLLSQFLSPPANQREDEYGGSLENRARFPLAALRAVVAEVGKDLTVICKINGSDYVEGGITLEEAMATARLLEAAGAQMITVSAGNDATGQMGVQPAYYPRGVLVPLAAGVKSAVSIPVAAVGRINRPDVAESILQEGKADLVAMGRALIADPELPRKTAEGRAVEIRPCTGCSFGCIWRVGQGGEMACSNNPVAGREASLKVTPADQPKQVVVVGGGPAGLEAARVAAERGHQVTLYEKAPELGGLLNVGAVPPHKYELPNLISYYATQMEKLGVKVVAGKEITPKLLTRLAPEALVVAAGGVPLQLPVTGDPGFALLVSEVLRAQSRVGQNVAIVGGDSVGCEVAEYLGEKGHKVTILEMRDVCLTDVRPEIKRLLLESLAKLGVEIKLGAKVVAAGDGAVTYEQGGESKLLAGLDNVVFALGSKPNLRLLEEAQTKGIEAYAVGDCARPGNVFDATHSAFEVAIHL